MEQMYPVGSIYMSVSSTNPSTYFGGTWTAWGTGRVPVGVNANDTNFATVEKTGGAATVILTTAQMPSHTHAKVRLQQMKQVHIHITLRIKRQLGVQAVEIK